MPEPFALLDLCKTVATQVGLQLLEGLSADVKKYTYCSNLSREIKALADSVLEKEILHALIPTGISILSEESGHISGQLNSKYLFIVDPLDGTFNFVKGLGPSAVSIALWEDNRPVFGVIYNLSTRQLAWGGANIGSYSDGHRISVSGTMDCSKASICTGFPVRLDVASDIVMRNFWRMTTTYAKVRMFGSASVSLLHVANGSADVYSEQNIMLWDVAAGLAIVEGAGGRILYAPGSISDSLDVYACNGIIYGPDWAYK